MALAFDSRHAGTGKSLVLGGAVLNDGNGGGNYALTLVPQAGSRITAAPLQITADPAHKTFDGTTDARTTWRVSAGTLFGTDTVGDVGLRYDSAEVGVGKRLHLAGVALNDGNGGANYSVTLADNTGSSIRLSSVENTRLEQVAANARSTVAPGAGSGPGFGSLVPRALSAGSAPIVLVGCGQRLPADLVADDPEVERVVEHEVPADAADQAVVLAGGVERHRENAVCDVIHHLHSRLARICGACGVCIHRALELRGDRHRVLIRTGA